MCLNIKSKYFRILHVFKVQYVLLNVGMHMKKILDF